MKRLSLEDCKKRIDHIAYAEAHVKKCLRRERIHNYIPGQVIYNLGEYPNRFSIRPTQYDHDLIASLAHKGVGLIQLHEEWNDSQRMLGADKYSSHDPEGLHAFIALCHQYGIKVLPYFSSAFFDWRDPDFTERFSTNGKFELNSSYFRYRCCDPASPEWNEYLMRGMHRIMEDYEFDGIYNDMGYGCKSAPAFGYLDYDPHLEDLLARIYGEVKERGGIVKIHQGQCVAPKTHSRVYDYLWVGECVTQPRDLLQTAPFDPYVIPCPDYRFLQDASALYAMAIPMMQFLLRTDGRPVTGERAFVPGVEYVNDPGNNEQIYNEQIRAWHRSHPNGPYVYSEWSKIPDDPILRNEWFDLLALYRPMVEEGSSAYLCIEKSTLTAKAPPADVYLSMFVNEECYLCVSNVGNSTQTVTLCDKWIDRVTDTPVRQLSLNAGEIRFLRRVPGESNL